jgi:hypothetical protein
MKHFVIGLDAIERATESALVLGPELDDDQVRREFYEARASGEHPGDWTVLQLHGERGIIDISIRRDTKDEKGEEHDEETEKETHKPKGGHSGKHSAK